MTSARAETDSPPLSRERRSSQPAAREGSTKRWSRSTGTLIGQGEGRGAVRGPDPGHKHIPRQGRTFLQSSYPATVIQVQSIIRARVMGLRLIGHF
jgi:hypothetical protein